MSEPIRIGLLGHGTVGGAFETLVTQRADAVEATTGRRPEVVGVLTRSQGDFDSILADSDVIVEVMGGLDPAKEMLASALRSGKHVITANKQLLSRHGDELWAIARENGVQLRFEAAVAGVVPVIRVLTGSLAGSRIDRIHGIVNGTTNFILSEMARTGADYADVLAEAQELGYAEADPTEDVAGLDAAAKISILARLAFGTSVDPDSVPCEGIEGIQPDDIAYASELGLGLKLIATAERVGEGISVRVHPAFLYPGHPLASVGGAFNAVTIESEDITEITLSGPGAGGPQTASAVLGDLVAIASGAVAEVPPATNELPVVSDSESAFYLHLEVEDRPGVLSQVATVLGDHGVSVRSVVQRGNAGNARLVMVSHPVADSNFRAALSVLAGLESLRAQPRAIRVIEEDFGG
ncbi:MAG: homoserine dehydrogenase [Actinobacteria bacterium]|uniref:Homoserine dehydrogenase n=1 Tax=freshwater metagenome TaxID=449393 RepID=A0A6J7EDQ3_9ZZZZ|nr:homoserine dehydrogenase [Actinomycetota bacterium]